MNVGIVKWKVVVLVVLVVLAFIAGYNARRIEVEMKHWKALNRYAG